MGRWSGVGTDGWMDVTDDCIRLYSRTYANDSLNGIVTPRHIPFEDLFIRHHPHHESIYLCIYPHHVLAGGGIFVTFLVTVSHIDGGILS